MRLTEDLEATLPDVVPDASGPGCSAGVVLEGELMAAAHRGFASLEHRAPIDSRTVFHAASLTKQFTAYTAALLAEAGHLDLDAPAASYLDWLPFPEPTVRQLVHHVSGLRDQWELRRLCGWRFEDVVTTADLLDVISRQRTLNHAPGERYAYTNTGYTVLACVLEHVAGTSLPTLCKQLIFEPLGMSSTQISEDHRQVVSHRADSYSQMDDGAYSRWRLALSCPGATGLETTLGDLAAWAAHAMTPEALARLERGIRLTDDSDVVYRFGVLRGSHRGIPTLWHEGRDLGFHAMLLMVPTRNAAIVVLANRAGVPVRRLADRIAHSVLGAPRGDAAGRVLPSVEPGRAASAVAGRYAEAASGRTLRVRRRGDQLVLDFEGEEIPLVVAGEDVLASAGARQVELRIRDQGVEVIDPLVSAGVWRRVTPTARPADHAAFAGEYWSDELGRRLRVVAGEEALRLEGGAGETVELERTHESAFAGILADDLEPIQLDVAFDDEARGFALSTNRAHRLRFRRCSH